MAESLINNEIYHSLGDKWYSAINHPIALLRKEAEFNSQWIMNELRIEYPHPDKTEVLDVGCGAGFLANSLSAQDFRVTGVDVSEDALVVARKFDSSKSVNYQAGDASRLPFASGRFDIVTCLDMLEHVEKPKDVVREIARVLKPNGRFFFQTLNRTWLSYLIAIKGVEWFIDNTPENLHIHSMFIKPDELEQMCDEHGIHIEKLVGVRPELNFGFAKMLWRGTVDADFRFRASKSVAISYLGSAKRSSLAYS